MKKELDFIKKYKRIILISYFVSFLIGFFFCPWKAIWEPIFGSVLVWTSLVGTVVGCYSMLR